MGTQTGSPFPSPGTESWGYWKRQHGKQEYIGALPLARDMLSAGEKYRGTAKICHEHAQEKLSYLVKEIFTSRNFVAHW